MENTKWCEGLRNIVDGRLTEEEKSIACKTRPRTPPKHIDLDLLDNVRDQIANHNYDTGSLLQFFSTAMMHLPIAYPKEYNNDPDLPEYFKDGFIKPPPSVDDLRYATNSAIRFLDDLFASTMQAIKDAGQWDNTIVYFTSDNGGAIYNGSANNNYPLRSSKFTPFEGTRLRITFMVSVRLLRCMIVSDWCFYLFCSNRRRSRSTVSIRRMD